MPITDYQKYMDAAASKGKFATYQDSHAETKAAASAISYGMAVEMTGGGSQAQTFQGGTFLGVALAREYYDYTDPNAQKQYDANEPVAVVRKGVIWVEVDEDAAPGDTVYAASTTGNFKTSATDGVEVTGAAFKSTANAGELVQLELNLPA
ncbi:structural cement protein Gp24 [Salibacterium sp. K-3]